jgi:hypothetical protein
VTNFQPNPEDFQPDILPSDTPELPFIPVEFYTRDKLAQDILGCSDATLTDTETGYVHQRDEWDNPAKHLTYTLFQCENNDGIYYGLDIRDWTSSEKHRYAFADWGTSKCTIEDGGVLVPSPELSVINKSLTEILRARHRQTLRGIEATAATDARFDDVTARFSAEVAIDHNFSHVALNQIEASDSTIRDRAYNKLFELSQQAGIFCDAELFQPAVQNTLSERRQMAFANGETSPLPTIPPYRPWPDFEITPKLRKNRNPFRNFRFFRR